MTDISDRAQVILDWAFDSPVERAAEGLRQVNELAEQETDPAGLAIVQDAGQMLFRLAPQDV